MLEESGVRELSETLVQVRLDIRELMTEVRSLKDLQTQVHDHETRLVQTESSAKSAHKRLDNLDRIVFWISTTIIGSIVLAILSILMGGGK